MSFWRGLGDTLGGIFEDVGDVVYDAAKWVGDTARSGVDQTLADLDDFVKASGENIWDNFIEYPFKTTQNIVSDPTDINSYSDSISDWYNVNDDYSEELYGTGGWKKAGMNFLSTGNPMYGAGDMVYQADSAMKGEEYNNGLTTGPKKLLGLYNLGSSIADATSATPTDTGDLSSTNTVNASMEPQIESFNYNPSYDVGAVTQDSLLNYGNTAGDFSSLLGTSTSAPSYDFSSLNGAFNALKDFSQTPTGKLGSIALGAVSPEAGLLGAGLQGIGSDDWSPFVKGLAQMYMTNRAKANIDKYNNTLQERINNIDRQYSMEGDIAKGLERRLERRDAASGRRSQYGARNTELAAQLAQLRAQQESPILSAIGSNTALKAQQDKTTAENQRMQTLMALWDQYNKPQFKTTTTQTTPGGTGLNLSNVNLSNIWK